MTLEAPTIPLGVERIRTSCATRSRSYSTTRLGGLRDEPLAVELDDQLMEVTGAVWPAAV